MGGVKGKRELKVKAFYANFWFRCFGQWISLISIASCETWCRIRSDRYYLTWFTLSSLFPFTPPHIIPEATMIQPWNIWSSHWRFIGKLVTGPVFAWHCSISLLWNGFRAHGLSEFKGIVNESMDRLRFSPVRGFLKGYMDLVFEHKGRFFLVDYKLKGLILSSAT